VFVGVVATAISDGVYFIVYRSDFFHLTPFARSSLAAVSNSLVTSPLWILHGSSYYHQKSPFGRWQDMIHINREVCWGFSIFCFQSYNVHPFNLEADVF